MCSARSALEFFWPAPVLVPTKPPPPPPTGVLAPDSGEGVAADPGEAGFAGIDPWVGQPGEFGGRVHHSAGYWEGGGGDPWGTASKRTKGGGGRSSHY